MRDKKYPYTFLLLVVLLLSACFYVGQIVLVPTSSFPEASPFVVKKGETIKVISAHLKEQGYIKSSAVFRMLVSLYNHDTSIQIGQYIFPEKVSLLFLVNTFVLHGPDKPLASITIPEGSSEAETIAYIRKALPLLSEKKISDVIQSSNAYGFLFPETYYLNGNESAEEVVDRMMQEFSLKYNEAFNATTTKDTLTVTAQLRNEVSLAAILEGEAKNEKDMKIVSGILQRRIALGMRLQVDVAKETYTKKGVPVIPVNSPGIIALSAVKNPIKTDYLYYITGNDGKMYYAKTFEEHKKNIKKYL